MGAKLSEEAEKVISMINKDELVQLVLDMCNIDSPTGYEKDVLEFIYAWFENEGFPPKKVGMLEDRYNVVAMLKGKGNGYSLLFNAHTDTALSKDATWVDINAAAPILHSAWRDGNILVGFGVINCKGPLAATMIAAKALKESGVQLNGDLLVTAVCSEVSMDPVDELQPPKYQSREVGTEYMVAHGVLADYALVAEGTGYGYSRVLSGVAGYKLTIALEHGRSYIPFLKRPTTMEESPNAIVNMAKVIEAFEDWAYQYQQKYQTEFNGATVIPKASIMGIRGGDPTNHGAVIGVCSLYIRAFMPPGFNPLTIVRELREMTDKIGVPVEIEPYAYRPGFEGENTEMLTDAIEKAHQSVFNEKTRPINSGYSSMWRDCNIFNAFGIPSVTYGPGGRADNLPGGIAFGIPVDELYDFAKAYALIALDICNQEKGASYLEG